MIVNFILLITATISLVHGKGDFIVLSQPESVLFKGHEALDESDVKELYSAALGFSIEHESSWPGMYLTDPFNLAEAAVSISVDGVRDLNSKGHHYPLRTNAIDDETFYEMRKRILDRYFEGSNKIVNIDLSEGMDALTEYEYLQGIKDIKNQKRNYNFLKANVDEDVSFMQELNLLNAITDQIERNVIEKDYEPDYYLIKFKALHGLSDLHGENSTVVKEAKQLLIDALNRLNNAFVKAYAGSALITVICSDASHTRRIRSAAQGETKAAKPEPFPNLNLAKTYNANYPVIFNIILWFGVVMVFALLAICIAIGSMDPGRDSIIYRMTSTRMKKDN